MSRRPATCTVLAVLALATACQSTDTTSSSGNTSSATATASSSGTPTAATSRDPKGLTSGVPTPSGHPTLAIPATKLPYKPAPGMPALDDVKILKTATDPCAIPADDSGEEAQLLDAITGGPDTINVTFSFTNPCAKPVTYGYKVTTALDSAKGEQAGGGALGSTPAIPPGRTIKQTIPVDVSMELTPAQQKRLWVGVTQIGKQADTG